MARTVSTKPVTVSSKLQDPYAQPCFAVYTCQHSVYGAGWMAYNHNLEFNSFYGGDGSYAYNRFRTYSSYSPEFYNNYASSAFMETQSYPSSNSEYCNNICNVGYLGHQNFHSTNEYSKTSGWVIGDAGRQWRGNAFRDVGVLANETDQDYAIFGQHNGTTGTLLCVASRSANRYYLDTQQSGINRFNIPIQGGSNYNGMYGSLCYNKKLNKLVVMEHNTSDRKIRPHVWDNVPNLRAYALNSSDVYNGLTEQSNAYSSNQGGTLYNFFQNTANRTLYDSNSTGMNNYSSAGESYWRSIPVLCDNGKIITFTMTPSNGCVVQRWNANGTFENVLWNGSWTTSYGYEQGNRFGSRWQVSTSGKYVWMYCPSYYYGAGVYWIAVRVSDGKFIKFQSNDSNHGRTMCPIGLNSMFWSASYNADGPGLYHKSIEIDYYLHTLNDGDTINLDNNYSAYLLDTMGNSTDYPTIIPAFYNTSLFNTQTETNFK